MCISFDFLYIYLQPFQSTPAALSPSLAGWMANPASVPHVAASAGPIGLAAPNNAGGYLENLFILFKVLLLY